MILAEVTNSMSAPIGFAAWMACAGFALVIFNQGFKAWNNLNGRSVTPATPQPLQVQETEHCVTRREFNEHVVIDREEHDKLFKKLGGVERGATERGDARAQQINAHIEEVRRELDGKIDKIKEQVAAVPAQTMALFDNAGLIDRSKS